MVLVVETLIYTYKVELEVKIKKLTYIKYSYIYKRKILMLNFVLMCLIKLLNTVIKKVLEENHPCNITFIAK